jgi:hypothetical protein
VACSVKTLVREGQLLFGWPAINHLPGWRRIRLQFYGRTTHLPTVERSVKDPFPQRLVLAQSAPDTKTEIASVGAYKSRADAPITPVPVNECQSHFAHLPGLLDKFMEESSFDDLGGMRSVKVNLDVPSPAGLLAKHSPSGSNEQYDLHT